MINVVTSKSKYWSVLMHYYSLWCNGVINLNLGRQGKRENFALTHLVLSL